MAIFHNGNGPDWKECAMISAVVNTWATLKHNLVQYIFPYIEMTATLQTMNSRWFSLMKMGEIYRYFYSIRMTSHVRHGVSNYRQLHCFPEACSSLHKKPTKALHHWPFIGWIHWRPVDSLISLVDSTNKRPIMRKTLPGDVIMYYHLAGWYWRLAIIGLNIGLRPVVNRWLSKPMMTNSPTYICVIVCAIGKIQASSHWMVSSRFRYASPFRHDQE